MAQTNAVMGPGGEAGVMRIKGTEVQVTSQAFRWLWMATALGLSDPEPARCTPWPNARARLP